MPYCICKVKLDAAGQPVAAELGRLDGGRSSEIVETRIADCTEVADWLRRGKLVWASFPTPRGLALGGLCRPSRAQDGRATFELAPGTAEGRTLHDMQQL